VIDCLQPSAAGVCAQQACQPVPCEQLAAAGTPKKDKGGDTCQVHGLLLLLWPGSRQQ
jgi:hypothetical protein